MYSRLADSNHDPGLLVHCEVSSNNIVVIDMGGGNSCTVTSTLLPGELPSVRVSVTRDDGIGQSCRYRARPAPAIL